MAKLVGQFSGFEKDMAALEKQVKNAFRASRKALADDMRLCLQDHVEADVYDKFQPMEYVRRREDGGLADMRASATVYSDERDGGMNLTLLYQPSGAADGEGEPVERRRRGSLGLSVRTARLRGFAGVVIRCAFSMYPMHRHAAAE